MRTVVSPLIQLQQEGQSIWLDDMTRSLVSSGALRTLVDNGLRGLTSNPTIYQKAIGGTSDYDEAIRALLDNDPDIDLVGLYERLVIEDICTAADIMQPVYESTEGTDGYVSLAVSAHLAHDTPGTVTETTRLWQAVDRPNLMLNVPATREGIPAIEVLIDYGINVNATFMFSLRHYEEVASAYIRGLERCAEPGDVASVASFFVSQVDTAVDGRLEAIGSPAALALRGKIAIANAKRVYRRFQEIFYGDFFKGLRQKKARVQRPLWGSTGTKNPAYSDVLYVEELIGPDTVTTVPPATLDAFRDHGQVRATLLKGWEEADGHLRRLDELGVNLDAITDQLQEAGVAAFAESFDQLLSTLDRKRKLISAQ